MKLFVFGSTGDLFKKKVINALKKIKDLEIIALGRKDLSHDQYFEEICSECDEEIRKRVKYLMINFSENKINCVGCKDHFDEKETNYFYIALPPSKIIETLNYIHSIKSTGHKIKILIEKPFGSNLNEALKLKEFVEKENLLDDIFLADHYLFKENIINIQKTDFKNIKIVSLEKVGIEKRIFYDDVGAINDMVQSHLLGILLKIVSLDNLEIKNVSIGQYKEYKNELGKESKTETYAKIEFKKGDKEISIETGKNFPDKKNYIEIDDTHIEIDGGKEAYIQMTEDFLDNKKENFPTIQQAIKYWKIIDEIKDKKTDLTFY